MLSTSLPISSIITTCKTMRDLRQVHAELIKTGRIHDPLASAEILRFSALPPHHDIEYARKVFDQMLEPNCFSWNTIIRAFAESDDEVYLFEALLLFRRMVCNVDIEPNSYTFPSVLKACARTTRLQEGKQVHGMAVKLGLDCDEFVISNLVRMYVMCRVMEDAQLLFSRERVDVNDCRAIRNKRKQEGDVVLCNVMIDGYVRLGDLNSARNLFDKMDQRSIVSWNVMISGYAQNGFFKEAIDIFHKMQMVHVCPNYVTLVSVLPAISRLGALELGKWVHLYAERNVVVIDDVLGSALADMYSKCGSIEKAVQVFEKLPKRNAITWSSMIGGFASHGRVKEALEYFSRMKQFGVKPNDVAYIGVLTACSHGGLVEEGRSIFNYMLKEEKRFEPRLEHYGCMVDLLSRAGHLEEAEKLILNMPIDPDDVIWKSLLNGCKMYGNLKMGKRAAEILIGLAPYDSGPHVALSNIYASLEDWKGVAEMRLMMKGKDVRKDPGCSWIEINGVIHEFLVEDDYHPKAKEIHLMLEEVSNKLREVGYRPDIRQVLLRMDEEEKERALQNHSERIAIAFGFISTTPKSPIRVVKNLRVCEDCHASIKLISLIYERKIIVRDRKRFHHFENGACSCMDYW